MAYAYCERCSSALSSPKIEEAAIGRQICECGEGRELREDEVLSTFEMFRERLEAMEEFVAKNTVEPLKPEEDPIRFAAEKLTLFMTNRVQALRSERQRREKYLNLITEDEVSDLQETKAEISAIDARISQLQTKIGILQTTPEVAFLPLGTVVEFVGTPDHPTIGYPKAGTIGVVTQLETNAEYFLGVSIARNFVDDAGNEFNPDSNSFPTYRADPGMLKVLSYGRLPGGEDCKHFGFVATHSREDKKKHEMIVLADDRYWRLHNFADRGVEALQSYENFAEMTWLDRDTFDPEEPEADFRP